MIETVPVRASDRSEAGDLAAGAAAAASLPIPKISVVIPTLNEEENLPHVLPAIPDWVHEIIVVDGHSVDRTVELAQSLRPETRILHQTGTGKGNALTSGFVAATGDIVVTLDADGSTDPHEIPAFVGALLSGGDFAKGSRFMQGGGTNDMELHRRLGNWGLRLIARALFGGRFTDLCYGYNAFWRRTLPALHPDGDGFEIEAMLSLRAMQSRLRIIEVASFEQRRIHGRSNLRALSDGLRVLRTILRERMSSAADRVVVDLASFGGEPVREVDEEGA